MSAQTCRRAAGILVLAGLAFTTQLAGAAKSDEKIKVTATADKPSADGKQVVTINLDVEKGWHAYANPISDKDFPGVPTTVTISASQKPEKVTVDYPKGKATTDPLTKDTYFTYEGKAVIKATVQRAKGDTSPLQVSVKVQACNANSCLQPATVKLTLK